MNIAYFPNQIARNAPPVLEAFLHSCREAGHNPVANSMTADAAVIWSQVWDGKMRKNQQVWQTYRNSGRKVFVLEVGSLQRGVTWRVGLNGVNGTGYFGATGQGPERANQLALNLQPWRKHGNYVLICTQRADSEQWAGQPALDHWVDNVVKELQKYTVRPIFIRPHPRFRLNRTWSGISVYYPKPLENTYDSYDIETSFWDAWAVVNWNSGPAVTAAMHGIPVFVGASSMAAPVGNRELAHIEMPLRPDRQQWLNDLAYTEWTVSEIAQGLPLARLL
jgi:hypothetical protein